VTKTRRAKNCRKCLRKTCLRTGPLFSREARAPKCWRHSKLGRFFPKNALLLVRFDLSRRIFRSKFACKHALVPKIGDGSQLFLLQMACAVSVAVQKGLRHKIPPAKRCCAAHTHARTLLRWCEFKSGCGYSTRRRGHSLQGNSSPTPNISLFGAELDLRDTAGCMIYSKPALSAFASGDARSLEYMGERRKK
jgi:hypothetical protein